MIAAGDLRLQEIVDSSGFGHATALQDTGVFRMDLMLLQLLSRHCAVAAFGYKSLRLYWPLTPALSPGRGGEGVSSMSSISALGRFWRTSSEQRQFVNLT